MSQTDVAYLVSVFFEWDDKTRQWRCSAHVICDHQHEHCTVEHAAEADPPFEWQHCRFDSGENEHLNADPECLGEAIGSVEVEIPITFSFIHIPSLPTNGGEEWDVQFGRADEAAS